MSDQKYSINNEESIQEYALRKQLIAKDEQLAEKDKRIGELEAFQKEAFINEFAQTNGGMQVHASWRDNMLSQDRGVSLERMKWETLDSKDRVLDAAIAYDVIMDYVAYVRTHPHEILKEGEA